MKSFYIGQDATGRMFQVTANGMTYAEGVSLGVDRVGRWALVKAGTLTDAFIKFSSGLVVQWFS